MAIIKPFRLFPGDRVGIVAPASSFEKRGLMRGLEKIRWWGFEPVLRKKIFKLAPRPKRYEQKANEIIEMFRDPTISAIFCAEGGYGSMALIPYLDEVDLSAFPKVFVGYSDISILLIYFFQRYGWVTFHGPTVAQEIYKGMPPRMEQSLLAAFTESKRLGDVAGHVLEVIRPGKATGRIVGGNLVRLVRTLGTPFEIQTRNRILFLEEVDEGYMEIDGALNHLKLAGKFDGIRGIVFSEMTGCLHNSRKNVRTYLRRYFRDVSFPVFLGFPSGHGIENVTIPLGVRVSIDSKKKRLFFEESGVR